MFCSNDNYMQDLYFYNQTPNNTYMGNMPNNSMMGNVPAMGNMNNMQNPNMMNNNMFNTNQNMFGNNTGQGLNSLYPSLYRIIMPVVSRVVSNSNFQFLNEDTLSNMVDTVYNIVEGQIEYDNEMPSVSSQSASMQSNTSSSNNTNSSNNSNTNTSSSSTNTRTSENRQVTNTQTSNRSNRNDNLLRDIIKILILREILSR